MWLADARSAANEDGRQDGSVGNPSEWAVRVGHDAIMNHDSDHEPLGVDNPASAQLEERVWSWVRSQGEQEERVRHASMLVGLRLAAVRYFDIDYFRDEIAANQAGPREITDDAEWRDPIWRCSGFDSVDYGIELEMLGGRVFSLTWDPPGMCEGIGMREVPLRGTGVRVDADVAVWDVSQRSEWRRFIGAEVTDVGLNYLPWKDGHLSGFWCPGISLLFGIAHVELLLGDANQRDNCARRPTTLRCCSTRLSFRRGSSRSPDRK